MKLNPTLRQKKRYVLFEVQSLTHFSMSEVKEEVEQALQRFFGIWGMAYASPQFVSESFQDKTQRFVVKVNHTFVDELRMGIILSKNIKNTPVLIRSLLTSGTLKTIRKYHS